MGLNFGIRVKFATTGVAYSLQAFGATYLTTGGTTTLNSTVRNPIAYALSAGVGSYPYVGEPTTLSSTTPGVTPGAPQALWNGGVISFRIRMTLWPPADGSNPTGYNFYRTDMPNGPGVPLNASPVVPAGTGIQYVSYSDTGLTPSTSYSYYATALNGALESGPSPTLSLTTLAATGNTPPASPIAPETYILPYTARTGLVWTATQFANGTANNAGSSGPKNNVGCGFQYALNNASAGDRIVLTSGQVYVNIIGSAAFVVPSTLSDVYITSDQDPDYVAGGKLPLYSYVPDARYTPYTATAVIALGATSFTLTAPFLGRTGWYLTKFTSANPSGIETVQALWTQGSTSVQWDIGLQAQCTTLILVGLGNHVSPWDAGIGINGGNINPSPAMPILQYHPTNMNDGAGIGALSVQGDRIRIVGICIQPVASNAVVNQLINSASVAGSATDVMFDRCVIGRNNLVSTRSFFDRCCTSSGVNVVFHQCYFFGCDAGPQGTDTHTILLAANGPLCIQNCYLESTTENTFVGGSYVAQAGLQHDETIRYNYSHKPTSWQQVTTVDPQNGHVVSLSQRLKNHFEIKSGYRFKYYGNLLQNNAFLNDSQGQQGRAMPFTSRDQISSTPNKRILSITSVGTLATAISQFNVVIPAGTKFFTTISGATNTIYNGSFTCTPVNLTTFTYTLPGTTGTPAGGTTFFQGVPQQGGMWQSITDVEVYDNQIYGVGQLTYLASNADFNPALYLARVWVHNNLCWENPGMTDSGFISGSKTKLVGADYQGNNADVRFNNNTIIQITAGTGYADPTITKGLEEIVAGPNDVLQDRWTVTGNIIDGTRGGYLTVTGGPPNNPNNGASGAAWITHSFNNGNLVFDKNVYPTDVAAYPGSNNTTYSSIGFDNFVSKTTMPTYPSDWAITSGPFLTDDVDGGPRGYRAGPPPVNADLFPRLRLQVIAPSGSTYANSTFQTNCGIFNVVDFGPYVGIEQDQGATFATIFKAVRAAGRANNIYTRCIHYVNSANQSATATSGGPGSQTNGGTYWVWTATLNGVNWWLRASPPGYPSGTIVIDSFGASDGSVMQRSIKNTVPDGSGRTFAQGFWNHYDGVLRLGQSTTQGYASGKVIAPNPYLDGYQMDNCMFQPRETGAWANDSVNYVTHYPSSADPTQSAWLQQGMAAQIAAIKAVNPKLQLLCNADYFVRSTTNFSYQVVLDPSLVGVMDMPYFQSCIGFGTSGIEGQGTTTTAQFMANLIAAKALIAPGGAFVFEQSSRSRATLWTSTNQASWVAADWQGARFGFACCLLLDGIYCLDYNQTYGPTTLYYLDEFGKTPSGTQVAGRSYLGVANEPSQTAARTSGVWYRVFAGGVVFMNPAGNGSKTITLATLGLTGMKAIQNIGFGDNTINTGAAVTSITLADRDGRVLSFF